MAQRYKHNKPYTFRFEQQPEYCVAKIKGDLSSLAVARQYWADIVKSATRCEPKRLLIWKEPDEPLTKQDTFTLVSELCQLKQFLHLGVAFLDEQSSHLNHNKPGEMIANNRGFTCRVFSEFREAEDGLLECLRSASS